MERIVKGKISAPNKQLNGTNSEEDGSQVPVEAVGNIHGSYKFVTSEGTRESDVEYVPSSDRANLNLSARGDASLHAINRSSISLHTNSKGSANLNPSRDSVSLNPGRGSANLNQSRGSANLNPSRGSANPNPSGKDSASPHAIDRGSISLCAKGKNGRNSSGISNPESVASHGKEQHPGPSGDNNNCVGEEIIPDLVQGLQDSLKQKPFDFNDVIRIYKASKYNKKAIRRISSGEFKKAFDLWDKSCKLGNSDAMFNVALCHELGTGVEQNNTKACIHYAKAADKDHSEAVYNLALMYLQGRTGESGINSEPSNMREATKLLQKAMSLGHAKAATELGVIHAEANRMTEARECFEVAASGCEGICEKDPIGCLLLAHTHRESGSAATDKLYLQAVTLLKKQEKDPAVQFFLGQCYEHGWGVTKDERQAATLYRSSNHKEAATRLKYVDYSDEDWSDDQPSDSEEESGFTSNNFDLLGFRPTIPFTGNDQPKKTKRKSTSGVTRKRAFDQQVPGDESSDDDDGIIFGDPEQDSSAEVPNKIEPKRKPETTIQVGSHTLEENAAEKLLDKSLIDVSCFKGSEPPEKRKFMLYRNLSTDGSSSTSTSDSIPSFGSDSL